MYLLQRVFELIELILRDARVDQEQESRGALRRGGQLILHSCELRNQLCRQVRLADVFSVVRREVVPVDAERARPELAPVVNLRVRVQDCSTAVASDGVIAQRWRHAFEPFQGAV